MTKPELAGDGLGLELRRLLVRGHGAPEQPAVQARGPEALGLPEALPGCLGGPDPPPRVGGLGARA
eukprot:12640631-Alexandrium_andersonii.AAC.1